LVDLQHIRRQADGGIFVAAVRQFELFGFEEDEVGLPIKQFFVRNIFVWQLELRFGEYNPSVRRKEQLLFAEHQFAEPQNGIEHDRADEDAEKAFLHRQHDAGFSVQRRKSERTQESDDDATERNFIGNDEVLEIDEGRDDKSRNDQAIDQRQPGSLMIVQPAE